jgi:DNA-binding beta-propeller fold protein YncE
MVAGRIVLGLLAAVAVAGCGSESVHELPRAAEPARAPALSATPAGRVVVVGRAPEGVAADPRTHTFAVAVRDPDQLALVDARSGRVRRRVALPGGRRHLTTVGAAFVVPAETGGRALTVTAAGRITADVAVGDHPHDAAGGGGRALAVVSVRERLLELYDPRTLKRTARAAAGVGPTHVVAAGDRLYVADTRGGALLVFATRPKLALVRRVYLPGGPYGIALDPVRHRLWVTLTARNEVVELAATGRPHPLVRWPTVRQPDSVAVDPALGTLAVTGRDAGVLQLIDVRGAR